MEEYCAATSTPPENTHKAFVIGSRIEGAREFIVCWSTPFLLDLQLKSELLQVNFDIVIFPFTIRNYYFQVDSTFSLTYNIKYMNQFPVQVCGFTGLNKKFIPTIMAVSSSENFFAYGSIFEFLSQRNYRFLLLIFIFIHKRLF
jgi:hypothetical protein